MTVARPCCRHMTGQKNPQMVGHFILLFRFEDMSASKGHVLDMSKKFLTKLKLDDFDQIFFLFHALVFNCLYTLGKLE